MNDDLFADLMDMHHSTYKPPKAERSKIIRAPFRMAGSKYYSLQYLLPKLPIRHTWVDHFGGTGIVTMNRERSKLEVFNDRYSGLTDFYKVLKHPIQWEGMKQYLSNLLYARSTFYDAKETWATEADPIIRAAKWLYCTANSVMGQRAAWARATTTEAAPLISWNSLQALWEKFHGRFKHVQIENLDFETCANDYDSVDTVHYFDPPYVDTGSIYEGSSWSREDQRRLLRWAKQAKGFVALSGYFDAETDTAIPWTDRHEWSVSVKAEVDDESKSRDGHDSQYVTEYLWIKER